MWRALLLDGARQDVPERRWVFLLLKKTQNLQVWPRFTPRLCAGP